MKHTPEALAAMSERTLNAELARLIGSPAVRSAMTGEMIADNYCQSWEHTGPLIANHKVDLTWQVDNWEAVADISEDSAVPVLSPEPLRAVVECLILAMQEKANDPHH